jgi:hypothetical protein
MPLVRLPAGRRILLLYISYSPSLNIFSVSQLLSETVSNTHNTHFLSLSSSLLLPSLLIKMAPKIAIIFVSLNAPLHQQIPPLPEPL